MHHQPPDDVLALAGSIDTWQPVAPTNDGGRQVWFAGDVVVADREPGLGQAEADRLAWLDGRIPAAKALLVSNTSAIDWLVTSRLAGHPALQIEAHGDMQGVPATLARALRTMHEYRVEPSEFPFEVGWTELAIDVTAGLDQLDPAELPDPYRRYSTERLVQIWQQGRPATEDLVLCHGNPTLTNLIIDPDVVGWVDVGRLRLADRHLDLAIAQYSIHRNFGPDAVFAFFDAYELDPDLVRLDHYLLANLLLP